MRLHDSEIMGLPVFTKGGDRLGTVADLVVDVDTHVVVQYVVSRSRLLSAIKAGELLVGRAQVVSVDRERMVVDDGLVEEQAAAAQMAAAGGSVGSGAGTLASTSTRSRLTRGRARTAVTEG